MTQGPRTVTRDSKSRLRRVISRCFPADARVIGIPRQADLVLAISWKLDPGLQDSPRRSKTIRLVVTDEILEHHRLAPKPQRRNTEDQIGSALREMLAMFDPVPGAPLEVVSWQLSL